MFCSQCGEKLKDEASFCHACGMAIKDSSSKADSEETAQKEASASTKSWLNTFGAFLFIPLFALIVVLLFWKNEDPAPIQQAANGGNAEQSQAPSMAAMNQVHETLNRLKQKVENDPTDTVAIDSLAVMFSIAGSYEKAKEYYEMHLEIEPDSKDAKIGLALTYHNLDNNEKATSLLQEILDKEPNNAFALHYLAEINAAIHNHEEAETYWRQIIAAYPGTEMARVAQDRLAQQSAEAH